MATVFWGIQIILLSVLLAIVGQAVAQRLVPLSIRAEATTSTGAIYAALYVMFGVPLAFALFLV